MNKEWHAVHALGTSATRSERITWHRAHQKHCACRPVPQDLIAEVAHTPRSRGEHQSSPGKKNPRTAQVSARRVASVDTEHEFPKIKAGFASDPQVTSGGKGFGAGALKVGGKIFAMVSSKQLFVVKLPQDRVVELVRGGHGHYFDAGKGKIMKEWLALDQAPKRWAALAREARRFVGGKSGL